MCIAPNHEFSNGGKITSRTFTAAAMVNLSVDNGKVFFTALRPDCGLDGRTGYPRIVAEEIGMKLEDVIYPRTEEESSHTPPVILDGGGGSVVFTMQGWIMVTVARVLKRKMLAVAAAVLKLNPEAIDIVASNFLSKSDPSIVISPVAKVSALQGISAMNTEGDPTSLSLPTTPTETVIWSAGAKYIGG
jgi:hypothetical protein